MTLCDVLDGSPYQGYTYAYPHKTAYRRLVQPISLAEAWADEPQDALFLYLHLPFCAARCGYCNLFSLARPGQGVIPRYLQALVRQAAAVRAALPRARFSRVAIGGGTPTMLTAEELDGVFALVRHMGADTHALPTSVEVSPATVTPEKLALLRRHGVSRLSIGVQAFDAETLRWLGRGQDVDQTHRVLAAIREAGFPVLNIDLIYGSEPQTPERWLSGVRAALEYAPEELYLYPLYLRPQTGLAARVPEYDQRLMCYRAARDYLLEHGYEQVSQRMFRLPGIADDSPAYCCQRDGMVGLGCGARSYTSRLHYATPYAVEQRRVAAILDEYSACTTDDFARIDYGFLLDEDESRRRYLLKTLLLCAGVDRRAFQADFGLDVLAAFPTLEELVEHGLAELTPDRLRLTPAGLERGDAIGPWLYSERVRALMEHYPWM